VNVSASRGRHESIRIGKPAQSERLLCGDLPEFEDLTVLEVQRMVAKGFDLARGVTEMESVVEVSPSNALIRIRQ
jgi:hypothetical protein